MYRKQQLMNTADECKMLKFFQNAVWQYVTKSPHTGHTLWLINPTIENLSCTSLVAQWGRNRLSTQGTLVGSLVWEDSSCCRAIRPVGHSYWACKPYSLCSTTREATAMRSPHTATKSSPGSPQLEKVLAKKWRPSKA